MIFKEPAECALLPGILKKKALSKLMPKAEASLDFEKVFQGPADHRVFFFSRAGIWGRNSVRGRKWPIC
jgi:hypothetical protein